jgi:dolichyl-phosphate-mannose-protein mannosyltransferase
MTEAATTPSWKQNGALASACAILVSGGVVLRAQNLGFPNRLTFDEGHFVENARNYLQGVADWNDHPPLGKLLMAAAMQAFGDNSLGWRIVPLALGIVSIALAYSIAAKLFRDERAGWIAAALLAVDGFFIAYSRTALLDGMLTCLVLATAATVVHGRKARDMALASVLIGLACSIKFSALTMVGPVAWVSLGLGRTPRWSVLCLGLAPLVYYASFAVGLSLTGQRWGVGAVVEATKALVVHHLALNEMKHPLTSHWYSWLVPTRPITLRFDILADGRVRSMTTLGNPLLWWASTVAIGSSVLRLLGPVKGWVSSCVGQRRLVELRAHWGSELRPVATLLLFWSLLIAPWVISNRDSYIYHYLPAFGFAIILVAGGITRLSRQRLRLGLAALLFIGAVSAFYAPVWGQLPISRAGVGQRLFVSHWR